MKTTCSRLVATASLALGSAVFAPLPALAVLVDFNTAATDFTGNFIASTGTSAAFTYGAAVGVSDQAGPAQGGGVTVTTDAGGANYNYTTSFDLGAGSASNTWTLSTFFRTNATTGTSPNQIAGVGFGSANTAEFGTGSVTSLAMTLRYPGSGAAGTVQLAVANNTGTNANTLQSASFTAATNTWYKMTVQITKTATADQFSLSGAIENWGSAGTSFSSTSASFSNQSFTNSSLYGDSSLFAGFFARQTSGNPIQIQAVDNFSVAPIPEPSAFAALAALATLGFAASRRRR